MWKQTSKRAYSCLKGKMQIANGRLCPKQGFKYQPTMVCMQISYPISGTQSQALEYWSDIAKISETIDIVDFGTINHWPILRQIPMFPIF